MQRSRSLLIVSVLAVGVLTMGASSCDPQQSTGTKPDGKPAQSQPAKKSSQEIYDQAQVGMTREQVVQLAGREPDNCTDSEIAGIGKSSICSYGTASITFQDGKVSSKTKL